MMTTTKREKILYVITKGNWGGAQRYVFDLATNLPPGEFEAVVACGEGNALPEKLVRAGIRCERISSLDRTVSFADIAAFREIFRLLKKERPDILHLNSSRAALLGAIAARLLSPSDLS